MKPLAVLVGLAGLGACVAASPSVEPPTDAQPLDAQAEFSTRAAPKPADPARAGLAARAVYDDDFARATLYTWTRVEQLEQLRASKRLLVADAKTGGWSSPFHRALADIPDDGSVVATLAHQLREHPELRRHRYAWPNPFATTMGLGARRYGDALVQIDLAPEAWIGRFEPDADEPLRFVDLEGAPVELATVASAPTRIAAIFHVNGPPRERLAFREYVVCSEAMVREWSIATPELRAVVEVEVELLEQLREQTFAQLPRAAILEPAALDWARTPARPTALALWHATLAFDNPRYRPGARELDALLATLAQLRDDGGPPLRHQPGAPS